MNNLKIAVVSSGAGHINRGVESWALDLAYSLHNHEQNVTLFKGGGIEQDSWEKVIKCLKRNDKITLFLEKIFQKKLGGWRYGLNSAVQIEQSSFSIHLLPYVLNKYDIIHTQETNVAYFFNKLKYKGLSNSLVIFSNGTCKDMEFVKKMSIVQELSPVRIKMWNDIKNKNIYMIPNFINVNKFRRPEGLISRKDINIDDNTIVYLCVGALTKVLKRIDRMIIEFSIFKKRIQSKSILLIIGGREPDTQEIIDLKQSLIPDDCIIMENVNRKYMPDLYNLSDVFVLPSDHEMLPISVLEAMSAELPIISNDTPILQWVIDGGGLIKDLSKEGILSELLIQMLDKNTRIKYKNTAFMRVNNIFSDQVVIPQIIDMYKDVYNKYHG